MKKEMKAIAKLLARLLTEVKMDHFVYGIGPNNNYIGVTKDLIGRQKGHIEDLKNGWKSADFVEAYNKIGDDLVNDMRVLHKGTKTYCYLRELIYRSKGNMGWNIILGGESWMWSLPGVNAKWERHAYHNRKERASKVQKETIEIKHLVTLQEDSGLHLNMSDKWCNQNGKLVNMPGGKTRQQSKRPFADLEKWTKKEGQTDAEYKKEMKELKKTDKDAGKVGRPHVQLWVKKEDFEERLEEYKDGNAYKKAKREFDKGKYMPKPYRPFEEWFTK